MRTANLAPTMTACCALILAACSTSAPPQSAYFNADIKGGFGKLPPQTYDSYQANDAQGATLPRDGNTTDAAQKADGAEPIDVTKQDIESLDVGVQDAGIQDAGTLDVQDSGTQDAGVKDIGVLDSGQPDIGKPDIGEPDIGKPDAGSNIFGEDIPWGSDPNTPPYDAGQYNYDVVNTGGNGPGLCNPTFTEIDLEKKKVGGKVDIIIFVDTSGSMGQESKWTNAQMNNFANYLIGANIDYRVILLEKDTSCCKMCIQPPLGGPNCSNNPPKFIHHKGISMPVYSKDGLKDVLASYPAWKQWLRPDATKNIIAVTDDDSYLSSAGFISGINNLNTQEKNAGKPEQFQKTTLIPYGFVFHSIVAYNSHADCPTLAKKGTVYLDLTAKTKGAKFKICEQNWTPIFQNLAKAVSMTAKPGCTYPLVIPAGVLSANDLSLVYVAEKDDFDVPHGKNNVCPANGVGFILDNPKNPKKITLCPTSCGKLNGGGNLIFNFGCG